MPKPATDGREIRTTASSLEVRAAAAEGGAKRIGGYAAMFNSETDIGGYFREKIAPGAFTKAIAGDVRGLFNHDASLLLGRTKAGTMRLSEDDKGLAYEIDLPDTQAARDVAASLDRGDIDGSSFSFIATREEWDETQDPPLRTILEAELYDVGPVTFPAYGDTEAGMRSLEHARAERRVHNKTGAAGRIAARRARQAQIERRI